MIEKHVGTCLLWKKLPLKKAPRPQSLDSHTIKASLDGGSMLYDLTRPLNKFVIPLCLASYTFLYEHEYDLVT